MEVSSGGAQTLRLSASGNAIGGKLSLTGTLDQSLTNLVVPQGVKLLDNVGLLGNLTLSGNLTNDGRFVAFSTNPGVTGAVISADNIYNLAGATLTTVLVAWRSSRARRLALNIKCTGRHKQCRRN